MGIQCSCSNRVSEAVPVRLKQGEVDLLSEAYLVEVKCSQSIFRSVGEFLRTSLVVRASEVIHASLRSLPKEIGAEGEPQGRQEYMVLRQVMCYQWCMHASVRECVCVWGVYNCWCEHRVHIWRSGVNNGPPA